MMQSTLIISACIFGAVSSQSVMEYSNDIGHVAYYYAFASYCSVPTIEDWLLKGSPPDEVQQLEEIKPITTDDHRLQAFVGWDPVRQRIVISFRGSLNGANWRTNLNVVPIKYKYDYADTGAKVHSGFWDSYQKLMEEGLVDAIRVMIHDLHPGADVLFTGHSSGAAMASIAAVELGMGEAPRFGEVDVITFGSPRWGNEQMVNLFHKHVRTSWRIVNGNDMFVSLPPELLGYRHVGTQIQYEEGSSTEYYVCKADDACRGSSLVDGLAFNWAPHNDYFGWGSSKKTCECDSKYVREGHGLDTCPSSHPDRDGGFCYKNCMPGYNMVGPTCWEYCDGVSEFGPLCTTQKLETRGKDTYSRGMGTFPDGCDPDRTEQNGLCHHRCKEGHELHGLVGRCLKTCDDGYSDHGLTCYKNVFNFYFKGGYFNGMGKIKTWCPSGTENQAGICYPHCKEGYTGVAGVCWEDCKENETNDGAFCRIPLKQHVRKSYSRGVGVPLQCANDEEQKALKCYPPCRDGFVSNGALCKPIAGSCITPTPPPRSRLLTV